MMNFDFNDNDELNKMEEEEEVSPHTLNKIRRLFVILVSVGLAVGIIASVVVVKALNHFGLTDKTPQFEHFKDN